MRRSAISWLVVFAILIGGFVASIAALNADLYSAHGFVRTYLDALARKDSAAALSIAGVGVEGSDDLLTDGSLGDLKAVKLVRDTENADGTHTVVYDYTLGSDAARSEFHVQHSGTRFGVFSDWAFVASPISTIAVTVENDNRFEVNGTELDQPGAYLVFTPGLYVVGHESTFLEAEPAPVAVTEPGTIVDATITVKANEAFVSTVQDEVDGYLQDCAAQTVLQPTGCPFGRTINNQVDGDPIWSITTYPLIEIDPGDESGEWRVTNAIGTANLDVAVRSLFDGTVEQRNDAVPFEVNYRITFDGDKLVIDGVSS